MAPTGSNAELRAARIAVIGTILGAIIGGLGSFAASYLVYDRQEERQARESLQAAYVNLLREAQEYRLLVDNAIAAVQTKDQATYNGLRVKLFEQGSVLFSVAIQARILSDEDDAIKAVTSALFGVSPCVRIANCDVDKFGSAFDEGTRAIDALVEAIEEDTGAAD
jgi:hypothetical protein